MKRLLIPLLAILIPAAQAPKYVECFFATELLRE